LKKNSLANYANFLRENVYTAESFILDMTRIKDEFTKAIENHKEILERTCIKIKSIESSVLRF